MPSPFPGMDPYLEDPAFWPDFHATFVPICREVLGETLPENYDAHVETNTELVAISAEERRLIEPDVFVSGPRPKKRPRRRSTSSVATAEQVTLRAPIYKEVRNRWINVLHRPTNVVVTVIEVLSPTNKDGRGLAEYEAKRERLLTRDVNLIELNLLVGGERAEIESAWPAGVYYALIARPEDRPRADILHWGVRDPLPTLPIPLREPDPDASLDLARAFALAYERAATLRPRLLARPPAPLSADDAT